jgi:hypothetical protein
LVNMDDIWKNAAKKLRARDLSNAAVELIPTAPITITTAVTTPKWCDPRTVTLAQIDENSCRLQRDWPKEDGIPFPAEILETLEALKVAVISRDAGRSLTITPVRPVQTASPESSQPSTNTILKKAEKKRRLREKRAAAHPTAIIVANSPATATIVSNPPTTADCSSNQIGTNIATAIPRFPTIATAAPNTSSDGYTTAHPERLYSLLTATAPTVLDVTPNLCKTDPNPADYSLNDIELIVRKIQKRHEIMGAPVPESVQETAEALTRAIQARDADVSTQTGTDAIVTFESDTATPAPTPARTPSPTLTTTMDPSNTVTTGSTTVVMLVTAERHDTNQHECEEPEVKRLEDRGKKEREDPEEESTEGEGNRGEKENREEPEDRKQDTGEETRVQTGKNDATRRQSTRFDWATDVDESFGPAPSLFVDRADILSMG